MFSYSEKENIIEFDKNRITQLTAPNGSGKSSIAIILQEVLFNKNNHDHKLLQHSLVKPNVQHSKQPKLSKYIFTDRDFIIDEIDGEPIIECFNGVKFFVKQKTYS